jgi:hypothetical protein
MPGVVLKSDFARISGVGKIKSDYLNLIVARLRLAVAGN